MKRILATLALIFCTASFILGTVPSDTSRVAGPYACDGSDTTFTWSFGLDDDDDLQVILIDADGEETTLTKTSDYTMASANTNDPQDWSLGGTITTVQTYSSSYTILLRSNTARTQTMDIDDEDVEDSADKLTYIVQDIYEVLSRCLKIQPSESGDTVQFPADGTAGYAYRAANGNWTTAATVDTSGTTVTGAWEAILSASATAGNRRTGKEDLGVDHFYDVRDYNVAGDGTDESTEMQAAVDAAEAGSGVLLIPGGMTIRLDSDVTVDSDLTVWAYGAVIQSRGGGFVFSGSTSDDEPLTADVAAGGTNDDVSVSDASAFSADDIVLLYSTYNGSGYGPAEWHTVASTAAGSVVFNELIQGRYDVEEVGDGDNDDGSDLFYQDPNIAIVSPITFHWYGGEFQLYSGNHVWIDALYTQHSSIQDVTVRVTGARTANGYINQFDYNQNLSFQNCTFYCDEDVDGSKSKGVLVRYSQNVRFTNCHWYNWETRALMVQFGRAVQFTGCSSYKTDGYIFTVETCDQVTFTGCTANMTPDTLTEHAASTTSRSGIFIIGSHVDVTGCYIKDCYGEGGIYIRHDEYWHAQDGATLTTPYYMCRVNISNCTVSNMDPNGSAASPAIYAKGYNGLEDIRIVNCNLRSYSSCVSLKDDIETVLVEGCLIYHQIGNGIYLTELTNNYYPQDIIVRNNIDICETNNGSGSAMALYMEPGYSMQVTGNLARWSNQTGSPYLFSIGGDTGDTFGNTKILFSRNYAQADGSVRGLNLTNLSGAPEAGAVRVLENVFDIAGDKYGSGVEPFVIEEVTQLDVNDADPNTYGLSKSWYVSNGTATVLESFAGAMEGQTINVLFMDEVTDVNFANTVFYGNSGTLWDPNAGDWMHGVYSGSKWWLQIVDANE